MTTTTDALTIPVGLADEDWTGDARFFEYHQAVDPLRSGTITPVPIETFAAAAAGVTGVFPLDLSEALGTPWAATGPSLLASFVLLGNADQTQTLTVTHTLWAMLGLVPAGADQRPHRHQSIALDLVVDCAPGCYTLLGEQVDPVSHRIVDAVRVDWQPGAAFV